MSQNTTLILLPQTSYLNPGNGTSYTVTGNSQPAAAYVLGNRDLQTISLNAINLTGNIIIEASLSSSPTDNDWFKVFELDANVNASANSESYIASNANMYTNVTGNFVYMRAKIKDFAGGGVNYVKLSY